MSCFRPLSGFDVVLLNVLLCGYQDLLTTTPTLNIKLREIVVWFLYLLGVLTTVYTTPRYSAGNGREAVRMTTAPMGEVISAFLSSCDKRPMS